MVDHLLEYGPWGIAAFVVCYLARLVLQSGLRVKFEAEVPRKR